MNSPSTRIRKRRSPRRLKQDSHQNVPSRSKHKGLSAKISPRRLKQDSHQNVPMPRRSSRLQPEQRSTTISQSLKHRPTAPQTSHTRLSTSDPTEEPVRSRAQLQGLLQTHTYQTQKRGLDRSIENSSKGPSKRARLTKDNLKKLEKIGKLTRKGSTRQSRKSKSSHSESRSFPSDESKSSSKTASTTDSSFPRLAFKNGVLDPIHSKPPENLGYWQDRLNRARDSESPTESEYDDFSYRVRKAPNEMSMLVATSTLLKAYKPGYGPVFNQALTNFPKNVGFNNGLSAAQPDMVEGLDLMRFRPFPADKELDGAAVPTLEPDPPTLSHLAGEWKGPGKDMILAQTQAAFDGAHLVYGRNQARSFLENPDPPGHAFVSTFTTDGTVLNTYAHYSSQFRDQVDYHQYPTSTSFLISSYKDYKTARKRLRNDQDDAKEYSEKLRDELNEKWSASQQYIHEEDKEDEDDDNSEGYFAPPISQGIQTKTADPKYSNGYEYVDHEDEEDGPSVQLLTEYSTNFTTTKDMHEDEDEDKSFVQIPTPDASSLTSKSRSRHKRSK